VFPELAERSGNPATPNWYAKRPISDLQRPVR
jgi:hypothetical protein